jgi:hypothetical protein
MDPLSDVLSLLKPRSYMSGGFDVGGELSIQFSRHEGIKCYALVSGQCWLSVEGVPDAMASLRLPLLTGRGKLPASVVSKLSQVDRRGWPKAPQSCAALDSSLT